MSMNVGGSKGGPMADINVTPMADIMIVLLIIFMVITPMLQKGVDVTLPQAGNTKERKDEPKSIIVAIKLEVIFLFMGFSLQFVDPDNWTPFIPESEGPERFGWDGRPVDHPLYFAMARGSLGDHPAAALDMTKWFDTNYHYLAPELSADQQFTLTRNTPLAALQEAQAQGISARPVVIGPLTFLRIL